MTRPIAQSEQSDKDLGYLETSHEETLGQDDVTLNSIEQEETRCIHCNRTPTNGIKCLGMCISDSEY